MDVPSTTTRVYSPYTTGAHPGNSLSPLGAILNIYLSRSEFTFAEFPEGNQLPGHPFKIGCPTAVHVIIVIGQKSSFSYPKTIEMSHKNGGVKCI
jgi:hypothetical protein